MSEPFDYDAALNRLVELRFEAERAGRPPGPEARRLEREIYSYIRRQAAQVRPKLAAAAPERSPVASCDPAPAQSLAAERRPAVMRRKPRMRPRRRRRDGGEGATA